MRSSYMFVLRCHSWCKTVAYGLPSRAHVINSFLRCSVHSRQARPNSSDFVELTQECHIAFPVDLHLSFCTPQLLRDSTLFSLVCVTRQTGDLLAVPHLLYRIPSSGYPFADSQVNPFASAGWSHFICAAPHLLS